MRKFKNLKPDSFMQLKSSGELTVIFLFKDTALHFKPKQLRSLLVSLLGGFKWQKESNVRIGLTVYLPPLLHLRPSILELK